MSPSKVIGLGAFVAGVLVSSGVFLLVQSHQTPPPMAHGHAAEQTGALVADLPHMTQLVGHSQRLADVLSYQWKLTSRANVEMEDMKLVAAAKDELEKDDADIRMNMLLGNAGTTRASIKEQKGYFEIFGRLKLPFSEGSAFEDGIDDAALLLPGELLRLPKCQKDLNPVILQSEAFPIDGKEAGLGLKFEPPIGYRVTVTTMTPDVMKHRLVIKTACLPPKITEKLN